MTCEPWQTSHASLISFLIFLALPDRQCAAVARLAGEVGGPLRTGFPETCLEGISIHFVNPKLLLAFGEAVSHPVVNGFGFLRWVDSNLRLHEHSASHRGRRLVSFADPFHLLAHFF